ncbi:glycosyltransferase family 2 protein [Ovoidimarina sediminis]|uniref:glycosyltransferase family 2 protein n=1 Tax=Ovoidimarina sediminis TaxID=3079856 RepID=UPI0029106BFF|nr:glycosyltransferase family 2 protein [Rhodophyticola sp. MJ-SS7]MDU8946712.1 glycosyltransferase family 2 protein [Rhodophyticola sp. MJ-SS7]
MKHYSLLYQDPAKRLPHAAVPGFLARRPTAACHVTILLGLYNGAAYLDDQLESFVRQNHRNWSLRVRDDGSDDDGPAIARRFAATMPGRDIQVFSGPRRGAARNFLSLLDFVPHGSDAIAFSDQDDVWLPGKLSRALDRLVSVPDGVPALYCGPTILTDSALRIRGHSPLFRHPPSLRNALVQSIAGGNTMVLNRAGFRLLRRAAAYRGPVPSHDWWAYQVITGAGGIILYDRDPQVLYRQHGANLVGSNRGVRAGMSRLAGLAAGKLRRWSDQNIAALTGAAPLLTPGNHELLMDFAEFRKASLRGRLSGLSQSGIHRQTRPGTVALWAAAAAGQL